MNAQRQDETSPRLAAGILAAAVMLPFAVVVSGAVITTAGQAIAVAVLLPAITGSVVVAAMIALRHLSPDSPGYHRVAHTKALARTILVAYLVLIVPIALLGIAGQAVQG